MTNKSKWLIAIPFALVIAFMIPALITQQWAWFAGDWGATLFMLLTAVMWLLATAFVDVTRPRGAPDAANRLIALGLILSVPVSVIDRQWGLARTMPDALLVLATGITLLAIVLGISARVALGRAYAPRAAAGGEAVLVRHGPYRHLRHPMYLAAVLWCLGWPLFVKSLFGSLTALLLVVPALRRRIVEEEEDLVRVFGDAYRAYQAESWRLIPYLY